MADLSELTWVELIDHIAWCQLMIEGLTGTGQDPVGTEVWTWYEEALDEADRRETVELAWRLR